MPRWSTTPPYQRLHGSPQPYRRPSDHEVVNCGTRNLQFIFFHFKPSPVQRVPPQRASPQQCFHVLDAETPLLRSGNLYYNANYVFVVVLTFYSHCNHKEDHHNHNEVAVKYLDDHANIVKIHLYNCRQLRHLRTLAQTPLLRIQLNERLQRSENGSSCQSVQWHNGYKSKNHLVRHDNPNLFHS